MSAISNYLRNQYYTRSIANATGSSRFHSRHLPQSQQSSQRTNKRKMLFGSIYPTYTEMISDIILYVIVVCNILTILFFTLVKDIEGDIVKQQINNLLDDIFIDNNMNNPKKSDSELHNAPQNNYVNSDTTKLINMINLYKNDIKNNMLNRMQNYKPDENSENIIKDNNEKIFNKSMIALAIINVSSIIVLFILWKYNKFDIVYYIKKNLILGIFVVLTEILFLYVISKNYIYIDKKYVLTETLKKITM